MNVTHRAGDRVLVIDDSPTIARRLTEILHKRGYSATHLQRFSEIDRVLTEQRPQVVILDLQMPGFSGLQFGRFIRRFSRGRPPSIIIYSSAPASDRRKAQEDLGAFTALSKDASPSRLLLEVRRGILDFKKRGEQ